MQIDAILVNNRRFSIGRSALVASSRRRFRCPCDRTPNHQPAVRKKTLVREVFLHQVTVLARGKRVCSGVPARVVPTIDADLRRGPAVGARLRAQSAEVVRRQLERKAFLCGARSVLCQRRRALRRCVGGGSRQPRHDMPLELVLDNSRRLLEESSLSVGVFHRIARSAARH